MGAMICAPRVSVAVLLMSCFGSWRAARPVGGAKHVLSDAAFASSAHLWLISDRAVVLDCGRWKAMR